MEAPVSDKASTSVELGDGALNDPTAGQDDEMPSVGPLDDLDCEAVKVCDDVLQFLPCLAAIG